MRPDNNTPALWAALAPLVVFVLLLIFGSADDNRLTSWRWVFDAVDAGPVYVALLIGIGLSWWLSRLPLPEAPLLFFISFASASAFWGEPEVIVDASRYFTQAKHLEVYGTGYFFREWGGAIEAWTDLPLIPFMYGLIFKGIGEHRIYIQALNAVFFSLTAVLATRLGKDLWGEETGRASGLLLLAMPYLFSQTPLMLVDVPSMFFLTLSAWSFRRALLCGGALMGLSTAAVAAALLCKYSLWPMLSVLVVIFAVQTIQREPAAGPSRATVAGRATIVLALACILAGGFFFYKREVIEGQIRLLTGFQREGLGRWSESFISTFLFQVHPFVTGGAVLSLYLALRRKDGRYLIAAWLPALIFFMQIKRIRYTVPVFPMLAVTASYGLSAIGDERLRRFVVLSAVTSSLAVAGLGFLPFLKGLDAANIKEAGLYLDTLDAPRVRVYTMPQDAPANPAVAVPLLDLYMGKEIAYLYETGRHIPPADYLKSPLRFTWHYRNPRYYLQKGLSPGREAVAVISGQRLASVPDEAREEAGGCLSPRVFDNKGPFSFRTIVTVCDSVGE